MALLTLVYFGESLYALLQVRTGIVSIWRSWPSLGVACWCWLPPPWPESRLMVRVYRNICQCTDSRVQVYRKPHVTCWLHPPPCFQSEGFGLPMKVWQCILLPQFRLAKCLDKPFQTVKNMQIWSVWYIHSHSPPSGPIPTDPSPIFSNITGRSSSISGFKAASERSGFSSNCTDLMRSARMDMICIECVCMQNPEIQLVVSLPWWWRSQQSHHGSLCGNASLDHWQWLPLHQQALRALPYQIPWLCPPLWIKNDVNKKWFWYIELLVHKYERWAPQSWDCITIWGLTPGFILIWKALFRSQQ